MAHGAKTAIGHAYHNLLEMTENFAKSSNVDQRKQLAAISSGRRVGFQSFGRASVSDIEQGRSSMKLFMWDRVGHASGNYHDEGGIVVIAETLERAREMIAASKERAKCEALTMTPDLVRECEGPEHISVHEDAGCC